MWGWLATQYNDIKGNFKWALLAAFWWLAAHYGKKLLLLIPNIPGWTVTAILFCLSLAVFFWLAKSGKHVTGQPTQSSPMLQPGIPTLSSLLGQQPNVTFNAREFFLHAWFSPFTAEIEQNIKIAAHQNEPQNPEAFYARFIGVGLVAYLHDMTWVVIYKSQLLLLYELNRRGVLPISEAKKFYDQAVKEYPKAYTNYSFEQWMNYLTSRIPPLIVRSASEMLDITFRGKDFLKYIAHTGQDINVKAS